MAIQATKAVRKQVKVRIALIGPSGSGKSFTALRIVKGLGGKTLMGNTEGDRGYFYAEEFDYDIVDIQPPYTPEKYIEVIEYAEQNGYDNLILDSGSHEWSGRGGLLEIHDKMPGNSYTNWGKINPRHNLFIDKQLYSKCNIINCLRGKDQYVLEEKNGKQAPKKVGMGAEQRANYEYEFTATFMLDQETHIATAMKDNTHIFEGKYDVLTEEHGILLKKWANSGAAQESTPSPPPPTIEPVNWPTFWAGVKSKLGYDENDVHAIASAMRKTQITSLSDWSREEVSELMEKLKQVYAEDQAKLKEMEGQQEGN